MHTLFTSITRKHYDLRTAGRPLMFTGVLIAKASSYNERFSNNGSWVEHRLFLLNSGKYVCYTLDLSGKGTERNAIIYKSKDQALKSFGKTRLGRALRRSEQLNRPKAKKAMSV